MKLGAAAILLLVARVADHYHLATRYGYTPRFERVVARFEAQGKRAEEAAVHQRTEPPAIPERVVADLPFFRLTRATNTGPGSAPEEVLRAVAHSLAALGGSEHPSDVPAVVRLVKNYSPSDQGEGIALREAQRILSTVPEQTAGRRELLDAVNGVLARLPTTKKLPARPESAPKLLLESVSWRVNPEALFRAAGTPVVVPVAQWDRLVAWFRSQTALVRADANNVALMARRAEPNGAIGVVAGVVNKRTNAVLAALSIRARGLDPEAQRMFGTNDVCVVT